MLHNLTNLIQIFICFYYEYLVLENKSFHMTKRDQKGQEWLRWVEGLNTLHSMKYSIQPVKLDSFSCSYSFYVASCASPDNSKRLRCRWQAFGTNLFWVGEAWEICFNYSPRRRLIYKLHTVLWVIFGWFKASAGIPIMVWISNFL